MLRSVKYAIQYVNSVSCVKWVQRSPHFSKVEDYVSFQVFYHEDPGIPHCLADVGRLGSQQFVQLGLQCMSDKLPVLERHTTVLHEMMHTLGLNHEHQRPNRDCYIVIWPERYKIGPFRILPAPIYYSDWPYDPQSVTHYEKTGFLFPRNKTWKLSRTDGKLSPYDIEKIKYLYCNQPSFCKVPSHQQQCEDIKRREEADPAC